jgi:hypothetical protein
VPSRQTFPLPQLVPFSAFPLAVQDAVPPEHVVTAVLHGSDDWQDWSGTHAWRQAPALQVSPDPQTVPSTAFSVVSTQTALPLAQLILPWWQGLSAVQTVSSVHDCLMPPQAAAIPRSSTVSAAYTKRVIGAPPPMGCASG